MPPLAEETDEPYNKRENDHEGRVVDDIRTDGGTMVGF